MSIQLPDGSIFSFSLPQRFDSTFIVATYVLSAVLVFVISLPSFRGLRRGQWALLACLAVASVPLNAILLVPASGRRMAGRRTGNARRVHWGSGQMAAGWRSLHTAGRNGADRRCRRLSHAAELSRPSVQRGTETAGRRASRRASCRIYFFVFPLLHDAGRGAAR